MGLHDRDYMKARRGSGGRFAERDARGIKLSVNSWIIIVNVTVFLVALAINFSVPVSRGFEPAPGASLDRRLVVEPGYRVPGRGDVFAPEALDRYRGSAFRIVLDAETREPVGFLRYEFTDPLFAYGHFSTGKSFVHVGYGGNTTLGLELWRFVTFQFVHSGILHLGLNMLGLLVFGSVVEQHLGGKKYLAFYLSCGIAGSVLYLGLNLVGQIFGGLPLVLPYSPLTPLVGASGGVFGVIVAAARLMPKERVMIPIPPVVLPLGWLATIYVGLSALNLIFGGANAGGDAAHVGGAIAGWFLIRHNYLLRDFFDIFNDSRDPPRKKMGSSGGTRKRGAQPAEVERILEKIQRDGRESLSDRELNVLRDETARRRSEQ